MNIRIGDLVWNYGSDTMVDVVDIYEINKWVADIVLNMTFHMVLFLFFTDKVTTLNNQLKNKTGKIKIIKA